MASRSSGMAESEFYKTSRRGRELSGDISLEQFPEKYEHTALNEDIFERLNSEWRSTLKDESPQENGLFAYEEPRRNVYSRSHLNLREGGFFGSTTDPYVTYRGGNNELGEAGDNDDNDAGSMDISFHDPDPRGYLSEQPWQEYRRGVEARLRRADFRNDDDMSTTGGGISPYTLYSRIRGAQNWVKARMKIFDESFTGQSAGGVGVYPHMSGVFKSSRENTSVGADDEMLMTFEDPEVRQRLTMKLSNIVHGGSSMLRTNDTTDHRVKTAAYGKLYGQRGLINHEAQMRLLEDDTPWSRIEGTRRTPKNLVQLMATSLEDRGGIHGQTAAQSARLIFQGTAEDSYGQEQFKGMRGGSEEMTNRGQLLTKDIMALLGFVEQDVRFLESRASYPGKQGKTARQSLAHMYRMAEVLHALPANVKLELRSELILRSAGFGLIGGAGGRKVRNKVVVNPKIVSHMDLMVRRSETPGNPLANRSGAVGDSEQQLSKRNHLNGPLFVYKSVARQSEDIDFNRRAAENTDSKYKSSSNATEGKAASYRTLGIKAQRIEKNKRAGTGTQYQGDAQRAPVFKTKNIGDNDFYEHMMSAVTDTNFGENKALTRHIGRIGTKNMRRYQDHEEFNPGDPVLNNNINPARKSSRNLKKSQRM